MSDLGSTKNDQLLQAIAEFSRVAQETGLPILLVGAYARDLFLRGKSGKGGSPRRTEDVDFGVMVDSWESFNKLRESLINTGNFSPVGEQGPQHKLLFQGSTEIDFIPFGKVADGGRLVCWPKDFQQDMNVMGFDEALVAAELVLVGGCRIPVITPESFVVLKLFAWNDRPQRDKDAQDLAYIFREYAQLPGKMDQLWEPSNYDLPEILSDFDRQVVRLLGRNVARVFGPEIRLKLCEILTREVDGPQWHLANQMRPRYRLELALEALADLRDGITDMQP